MSHAGRHRSQSANAIPHGRRKEAIPIDRITNISLIIILVALMLPIVSALLSRYSKTADKVMKGTVLCAYIAANLYETILFRTVSPEMRIETELLWSYKAAIGLYPALSITDFDLLQEIILNILLYIPLGYLLPFTFERLKRWQTVLIGFLCSVLTEVTQLVCHIGLFEFDDMLNNTIGCAIGVLIFAVWMKQKSRRR